MKNVRFSKDHEWVLIEGDTATIGITDYAQSQLGDIVFVELPALGRRLSKGEEAAVVESVKAASEVYAPIGGEVIAVNQAIVDTPALVNEEAEGRGWFAKVKLSGASEAVDLMDEAGYRTYVESLK